MSSPNSAQFAASLLTAALVFLVPATVPAQEPLRNGLEGGPISWRPAESDVRYRIHQHQQIQDAQQQRFPNDTPNGGGCEWLRFEAESGSKIYLSHQVGHPRICEELATSVWVKSDRAGMRLAARIVLPRTKDPRTGQPLTTDITGSTYSDVGRWQQLRLDKIASALRRQMLALRIELGSQVDEREAYVDAILLNVYGGPGITNVWIDEPDVAGFVATRGLERDRFAPPVTQFAAENAGAVSLTSHTGNSPSYPTTNVANWNGRRFAAPAAAVEQKRRVARLDGSILEVGGQPIFPRIIQHCGEPLERLKQIGFNAVWLQRTPAPEVLEEARRLGLWLVCPPPRPMFESSLGEQAALAGRPAVSANRAVDSFNNAAAPMPMAEIGPQFDCVLAWNLGCNLEPADLEATRRWADQIRAADRRNPRPLICRPNSDLYSYSKVAQSLLLLVDRRPVGTSLEFANYGKWLAQQPLLARAETPIWATVQTQPAEALRRQLVALEPGSAPPMTIPPEQIRLSAYTAIASGCRGLLFLSDTPLDASDPETSQRAASLELLNWEFDVMEPWAAAGSLIPVDDITRLNVKASELTGSMLRREHARLLLPIWSAAGAQYVPPQSAANNLSLVVHGVSEGSDVFELAPGGISRLDHRRVAGGTRITLKEFGLTSQILLANDSAVIADVRSRMERMGRRSAELQRQLAVRRLSTVQAAARWLASRPQAAKSPNQLLDWDRKARKDVYEMCDAQLAAGDFPNAALSAQRAMRKLRMIEREYWDAAVQRLSSPVASPGAVSFDTLPWHWRLIDRIQAAQSRFGPNLVPGGDFEDAGAVARAGWQFIQQPPPRVRSFADFVAAAAHSGSRGLRLAAAADDPEHPPAVIENPPVIFVSPAVPVEAGQVVCIHGWVNVPTAIRGNVDGLMIVDSLAGEALAERIQQTNGWREFAMYRAAPQSGTMSVIFALSGLGEARIDDVMIQALPNTTAITRR